MFLQKNRPSGAVKFILSALGILSYPSNDACNLEHTDIFTISLWYYLRVGVPANVPYQFSKFDSGNINGVGWGLFIDTSERFNIRFSDGAGGQALVRMGTVTTGWNHIVVRKIASSVNTQNSYEFFLNGWRVPPTIAAGTYNTAISAQNNSPLEIGGASGNASRRAEGFYRDFRIYKGVELDTFEIRRLYNMGYNSTLSNSNYTRRYNGTDFNTYTASLHLINDGNQYIQPGGANTTMYWRDELTKQYTVTGSVSSSSTHVVSGYGTTFPMTPANCLMTNHNATYFGSTSTGKNQHKSIRFRQGPTALGTDWGQYWGPMWNVHSTTTNNRVLVSEEKCVGNGKVMARNLVNSTGANTIRHTYIGVMGGSETPGNNITDAQNKVIAGFGNQSTTQGWNVRTSGSIILNNNTVASNRTVEIEVDFDADQIICRQISAWDHDDVVQTTTIASASLYLPNNEWYVLVFGAYTNEDLTFRQTFHPHWGFNGMSNPGYLADNDIYTGNGPIPMIL